MARESTTLWVSVSVAFIVVAGLWYYSTQLEPGGPTRQPLPQPEAPTEEPAIPAGPLYPMVEPAERPDLGLPAEASRVPDTPQDPSHPSDKQ